jgi:hypothetical protein
MAINLKLQYSKILFFVFPLSCIAQRYSESRVKIADSAEWKLSMKSAVIYCQTSGHLTRPRHAHSIHICKLLLPKKAFYFKHLIELYKGYTTNY